MGHQRIRRSADRFTRYRLHVTASDVGELVTSAGGWICDRIHAGWDVTVSVDAPCDVRPLQILGVTTVVIGQQLDAIGQPGDIATVAFPSTAFDHDETLRTEVLRVLEGNTAEVTTWGSVPGEIDGRVRRFQYRLTGLARAFKAHAVAAAALPTDGIGPTEDLYTSGSWHDVSVDRGDTYLAAVTKAGGVGN
ncbi:hypothetical protein HGA11_06470 [Mycolicibacterium septicum DSM 44393]|uniref:Uncharacterized protein n=1 Tax=Mycolicibacterium septicum DSM 44393 TaxID=1341646 RepID=A0A7X6MM17_9MYCO|nr:hypothetical protein [Mycolicibacterium septicum]NKZ10618.1 hypothetical protein [Mycolicibacterium septicum DSM 44393]